MKLLTTLQLTLVGLCGLFSLIFSGVHYYNARLDLDNAVCNRLKLIAGVAAQTIDGDVHATLRSRADESADNYKKLKAQLAKVQACDPDISFIYTMREMANDGDCMFVVDATEDEKLLSHLGDVYDDVTPVQRKALRSKSGVSVEDTFSTDEWGTFRSAYAPILDANGKLDGVVGVDLSIEKYEAAMSNLMLESGLISMVITILGAFAATLLARRISAPISTSIALIQSLSAADLTKNIPPSLLLRKDEIGELGRATELLRNRLRQILLDLNKGAQTLLASSVGVANFANILETNSHSLYSQVSNLSADANRSAENTVAISSSAAAVVASLNTLAEFISSVNHLGGQIGENCQREKDIMSSAEDRSAMTCEMMQRLDNSSQEISKVVDIIDEISAQTKILALNASIEANRVGNAGKGFAAVADEIKELARQSAVSTQVIRSQIGEAQSNSVAATEALQDVNAFVQQISEASEAIDASTAEQSTIVDNMVMVVAESKSQAESMSEQISRSAQGFTAFSNSLKDVEYFAVSTAGSVSSIKHRSEDLKKLASELEGIVKQFAL